MNFTKELKKIALYFGAFIGLLSLTAGLKVGVFFINKPVSVGPTDSIEGDTSPENESLSKILDTMLTTDKANFDLNLVLESEASSPISVSSDIFLSMPTVSTLALEEESQDESLKISLKGDVQFNNQTIPYEINCLNGFIYANLGDVQIKIKTENFMGDLNTILDFAFLKKFGVNIALPDLSQFKIGPEMISMLASQLTETETETGKQIKFNILELGWIVLQTDVDYVLQNISLEGFEFSGTKLSADVKANLSPLPQEIVEPENKNDMTDLTGLTNFLKVVDELITKGRVGGNAIFKIMDKQLTSQYNIDFTDFNNLKAYFKTKFVNNDFELVLHNNDVYITYADCKYCFTSPFDFTEIAEALEFYAQKFGFEISQNEFSSILEIIDVSDLNQLLKTISNLKVDETGLNYSYQDLIFNLSVLNGEFDKITASFKDIVSLDIDLNSEVEIPQIDENDYKNLLDEKLFSLLHKQLIVNKNLSLQAEIKFGDISVEANLKVDFKDETKVQLQANVFDRNILLTILDTKVYLEVDNILKASGTFEQLISFIKSLNLVELTDNNIEFTEILQAVLDFLDNENVVLTLLKENGIVQAFEVIEPNVHCVIEAVEFEEISYTENGEYVDLVEIGTFVKALTETLFSSPLAFDVNVTYGEYTITGKIQYISNELSAKFNTTILDKNLSVEIENTTVYVNFDGLKFKCSMDSIKDLVEFIQTNTTLISGDLSLDINLDDVVKNIGLSFSNETLIATYQNINVELSNPLLVSFNMDSVQGTITLGNQFDLTEKVGYFDFDQMQNLFKATINTLKNMSISGEVEVTLNLFGEDNILNINYAVGLMNNKLIGYISTTFKGLNIVAYIDDKDVYVDVVGLKVHINIDNISEIITWINQTFNTNIEFDLNSVISQEKLENVHLDIIQSIATTSNSATIVFNNGLTIGLGFDDYIRTVEFANENKLASLTCTDFNLVNLDNLNRQEFKEFDVFKTLINNIYSLAMSKQYDLSASVQKYVDNALINTYSASAQMDISSSLNAYFDLVGLGEQITINYENKNLYFCYGGEKGLKLSIQESAIQEILAIVCSALKIDTSSIPFLDEFLQKENIDTGNLNTIMPEIDFGNPLQYMEYIEVFDITDSYFAVTLRAEKLGEFAHGKDVSIKIYYSENSLLYIEINNLYITSNADEFVNVTIDVNNFTNITSVAEKEKYIDISGAKDLLRAFVNTSNLTDWHIKGKVQLDISLGSLSMSAAQLDVDIQVKLVNNKPVIAVEVSNYPLIGLVNNSNTNGIGMVGFAERYRTISVYYQDGELYLKATDAKYGVYKQLIRTTKITPSYLVKNLSYYTQYLLGFTDTIQTKIDEAIEKSLSYTGETDYGNIILEYTQVDRSHTIKLNLTELAHNPDIGTLSLTLTTLNNETTNNLDYLYRIDLDLNMLDNLISLKTDQKSESQGLYLTNIGETVDISKVDEIKQLYEDNNFVLDGEYEKEGDKAWEKANTGSSKITFISEGKEIKVEEGEIASNITFPTMSNFILEDDVIWQEFEFVGWFYDEQFATKFTQTTMPRYDTVLYAKWQVVKTKYFATISFETNQEHINLDSIIGFIGDNFTLPVCNNFDTKQDENTTILYTFVGWFTAQGEQYVSQQFDQANLTLYAHWTTKVTVVHNVQVVNNGVVVLNNKFEKGTKLDLSSLGCFNSSTLVYSSQTFEEDSLVQDLTINSDITLYLRNKFKVTIKSDITTLNGKPYLSEQELYEGSTISLPQYSFFVKDMESYTIENTFLGYTLNGQLRTESTVATPNGDCVFEASWNSVEYCIVTFEIVWSRPSGWVKDGTQNSISQYVSNTNNTNQVKIQRNTELVFENYVAEANYEYKIMGIAKDYDFKTVAWAVESKNVNAGSYKGATSMTITSNCTLKPIWKGIY